MHVTRGEVRPLAGRRLLVPPSRLENNVLAALLAGRGAEVVSFPALRPGRLDVGSELDRALARPAGLDWLVVAGEASAVAILARLRSDRRPRRVAAIGSSAARALRQAGLAVESPPAHTADAVAAALGPLAGRHVLLVRERGAPAELPRRLRAGGAEVAEAAGYAIDLACDRRAAAAAFARPLDAVAFANPTAVRLLARAADILHLELHRCLAAVPVAAVGTATAAAAEDAGVAPDLVAGGRLSDLVGALVGLLR